jgi:heptosyltransferase-2
MAGPEKILIVGPAWIGDMVISQSLFMLLRQQNPQIIIDVVAPAWSKSLLDRMPEVRRIITMPVGHGEFGLRRRYQIGRSLQTQCYDRSIVIPRSLKSALVPFFAGAKQRTGFRAEMRFGLLNDLRVLDRERLNQTIKRFISLGVPANTDLPEPPVPVLAVDQDNLSALRQRLDLAQDAVALMPGAAYGPAKCWPIEYFSELAAGLTAAGTQVWVLGSESEAPVGEAIADKAGAGVRNLCGQTRLEDTVDLLSATRVAVSNDSGLMHVAAAAGAHVIAIYGSTSPNFTPPLTARQTIYYLNLECSPCFKRDCPLGHLRCLREILPETVLAGIRAAH